MRWARNLNFDQSTKPTWELVVLMILLLAVETAGDLVGCVGPRPDYQQCKELCGGAPASVGVNYCNCHPEAPAPSTTSKEPSWATGDEQTWSGHVMKRMSPV